MKKILILPTFLFCAIFTNAQVKFVQLQKCVDPITKLAEDSCCVLTGADGFIKYLQYEDCKALFGGTVSVNVSDSTLEQGGTKIDNICLITKKCETLTYITKLNDTTYVYHDEESGTDTILIPSIDVPPPTTITVTDSIIYINGVELANFCDAVKKCETVTYVTNNDDGSYTYTNEQGLNYSIQYKFDKTQIPITGWIYLVDHDGTISDSLNICEPGCPPIEVTATDDEYDALMCVSPIEFDVSENDGGCTRGETVYSWTGVAVGGYVIMDASGHGFFYFTDCDASAEHSFTYQACCIDGVCTNASVVINLPICDGNAIANEDFHSGKKGLPIVFSLGTNDGDCGLGHVMTYDITLVTENGTISLNKETGIGVYTPLASFTGIDSAIYTLYCDGVACDTAFARFKINDASPDDDYYTILNGQSLTDLDATANDTLCASPGVTTFAWNGDWINGGITSSGDPDSFNITSIEGYCGQSFRIYDVFCDAVYSKSAVVYVYHVCAQALPDIWETSDSTFNENVRDNDIVCNNGGSSTFHLVTNPTSHGTGLNITVYGCGVDHCPNVTPEATVKLIAWDTITGKFTIDFPDGFDGAICFEYYLKCKLADGSHIQDTTCVEVNRVKNAVASVLITMPIANTPGFNIKLGGYCETANGKSCLNNGDTMHMSMVTLQGTIDVDLIVGQNVKTVYFNDVSNRWQNWVVPAIRNVTPIMTSALLCAENFNLTFRKDSFSYFSNNWGDGEVSNLKIGQELYWRWGVKYGSCGNSSSAQDTLYKLWGYLTQHGDFLLRNNLAQGGCAAADFGSEYSVNYDGAFLPSAGCVAPYITCASNWNTQTTLPSTMTRNGGAPVNTTCEVFWNRPYGFQTIGVNNRTWDGWPSGNAEFIISTVNNNFSPFSNVVWSGTYYSMAHGNPAGCGNGNGYINSFNLYNYNKPTNIVGNLTATWNSQTFRIPAYADRAFEIGTNICRGNNPDDLADSGLNRTCVTANPLPVTTCTPGNTPGTTNTVWTFTDEGKYNLFGYQAYFDGTYSSYEKSIVVIYSY